MNEFFDPNDERHDTDMATLLQTLPDAPAHGDDFWASLDAELDEVDADRIERRHRAPRQTGLHGRTQFMLVAAALVMVAGAIGIAVNNQAEDEVTTADAPEVVSDDPNADDAGPTTTAMEDGEIATDDPVPTGDRPFVFTGPGTPSAGMDGAYYVDEVFSFDLLVPDGFVDFESSTRGAYFVHDTIEGGLIRTYNLFDDDEVPGFVTSPFDGEVLVDSSTVEMPLYTSINDSVTPAGTISADQFVFERSDGTGERIVRVVRIENRLIVIEVDDLGTGAFPDGPEAAFDAFRLYDDPEYISDCSTSGLPALPAPAELNAAQAARYEAIMDALTTCNLLLLVEQVDPEEFFASIVPASDPLQLWSDAERYREPTLQALYDYLALPVGFDAEGEAQWPRDWATPEGPDAESIELLIAGGYLTETEVEQWGDELFYANWRIGIDADGNWKYFVQGD